MLVGSFLKSKRQEIVTAKPWTSVADAMGLLITNNIGCLPILDDGGNLVGVVSDKDIFRHIHETGGRYQTDKVSDLMTTEVIIGLPTDDVSYITDVMDKAGIRHVLIVDGNRLIGLVSQRDIIKHQAHHKDVENRYLNLYMEGLGGRDMSGQV